MLPRVLIVTQGIPHPREGASTVIYYEYVRGIAGASKTVLNLILTDRTNRDERLLREYRESLSEFGRFDVVDCPVDSMYSVRRLTRAPFVPRLPQAVLDRIRAFNPDAIVCFDILPAAFAEQFPSPTPRIVWLGDLHFHSFWYNALYDVRDRRRAVLRLPLIAALCWQWRRLYARVLSRACRVIVSSKSSEAAMRSLGIESRYLTFPWPEKRQVAATVEAPPLPTFALFGSLSGLGSRSSFDTLMREVYPALVKTWGPRGFRILLAGVRNPPAWALKAIEGKPEMVFMGFVDDIVSFMRGCHAVVVPIAVPVGNRTRILTALAHGALVIAHRNTALGNSDLRSGDTCLLASTPDEFAAHLRFAVESPAEARAIAARGQAMYQQKFAPAPAVSFFLKEIESCVRKGAAA